MINFTFKFQVISGRLLDQYPPALITWWAFVITATYFTIINGA